MKFRKLVVYVMVCAFIGLASVPVGVQAVEALQAATLTATNTFVPPSPTSPSISFPCPSGTPSGWGTYTPSPLWSVQCGGCSVITSPTPTGTPSPIPTWNGTGTPPATLTSTITPTGTAVVPTPPTSNVITCGTHTGWTCSNVSFTQIVHTCIQSYYCDNDTLTYFANHSFYPTVHVRMVAGNTNATLGSGMSYWSYRSGSPAPTSFYINDNLGGSYYYLPGFAFTSSGTNYYWGGGSPGQQFYFSMVNTNYLDYAGGASSPSGARVTTNTKFYISVDPLDVYTPTPSPTPIGTGTPTITPTPYIDTGYCSTVGPTTSGFGFTLFVPVGDPNCDMGWNEFTVGESYTIPAVQICIQPSEFGVITLFDQQFEVGIFALAAAAAFFWRFFRTV